MSQSRGDSVRKFMSGHTSTAGSTGALVQLSTATAGKVNKGPNFMSSNGKAPQPIPATEIYDEVNISIDQKSGAAASDGDEISVWDCSKSAKQIAHVTVMRSLYSILI